MKNKYLKSCTLPENAVVLLKNRGLSIANEQKAVSYLANIGYFRLSAYLYPLLKDPKTSHLYKEGSTFEMALDMYRFDRKLRILLFNEIEKIEVAIRSAMNNLISISLNDVFWMTSGQYFRSFTNFEKTRTIIQSEMKRTKEEFIEHFCNKYADPFPPAWMISEIIPLGVLCGIYNNFKIAGVKKKIANQFGLPLDVFSSWILMLANLRNVCCHHNRAWNKDHLVTPADMKNPEYPWIDRSSTDMKRIYYRVCIIKYLLFTVSPNNAFACKLKALLGKYPTIDVRAMGFPDDWQNEPLWR